MTSANVSTHATPAHKVSKPEKHVWVRDRKGSLNDRVSRLEDWMESVVGLDPSVPAGPSDRDATMVRLIRDNPTSVDGPTTMLEYPELVEERLSQGWRREVPEKVVLTKDAPQPNVKK